MVGAIGEEGALTVRMRVLVHTYMHIGEGNVDMGITGQDIVQETRLESPEMHVKELMVSQCVVFCSIVCLIRSKGSRESHSTRRTTTHRSWASGSAPSRYRRP